MHRPLVFSPRRRRAFLVSGTTMLAGGTAVVAWWLLSDRSGGEPSTLTWWMTAGRHELLREAWPLAAAIISIFFGTALIAGSLHGRRFDPWPGNAQAPWNRRSLYRIFGLFSANLLLSILIPLAWMVGRPRPWQWWEMWLLMLALLPATFLLLRQVWHRCREDEAGAGR
jgi:hypothetical protein